LTNTTAKENNGLVVLVLFPGENLPLKTLLPGMILKKTVPGKVIGEPKNELAKITMAYMRTCFLSLKVLINFGKS
jgi:hypothetical protein